MKIPKKFIFTEGELINYLQTVNKFSKIDNEILATLTYKKAYDKLHSTNTLVSFPCKENKETEISKRPLFLAKGIGSIIKKFAEENSPIDSLLINPVNSKNASIRPLQIKFVGKGQKETISEDGIIDLLIRKSDYEQNDYTLVLVLEGKVKAKLQKVVNWLKNNDYPFAEVVLINPDNKTGIMEFFQLKPSKKTFASIRIDQNKMLRGLKKT